MTATRLDSPLTALVKILSNLFLTSKISSTIISLRSRKRLFFKKMNNRAKEKKHRKISLKCKIRRRW
jgi:hypothetical protein